MTTAQEKKTALGWREWVSLPDLGISAIKAKVDTGAKTSALHAFKVEAFQEDGIDKVCFQIHPLQKRTDIILTCVAPIADQRMVTDSGGHQEMRFVISTNITIGNMTTQTELTLTDRDSMQFRMLLGRSALTGTYTVDPAASYLQGLKPKSPYKKTEK